MITRNLMMRLVCCARVLLPSIFFNRALWLECHQVVLCNRGRARGNQIIIYQSPSILGGAWVLWYGSHIYLNEFITENQCKRIIEIGVYNGENAVSMIKTAIKIHPANEVEYYGFDFFSQYNVEHIKKKLDALECKYSLFKGNTMDTVPEAATSLPLMDLIFIDGGKSYKVAVSDWEG
jgi:hypothetical protein